MWDGGTAMHRCDCLFGRSGGTSEVPPGFLFRLLSIAPATGRGAECALSPVAPAPHEILDREGLPHNVGVVRYRSVLIAFASFKPVYEVLTIGGL